MPERDGRLTVGIVGAGRVGPVIGAALAGAGHLVTGISASSPASRERAEALLPGVVIRDVIEVVANAELVVVAVPDNDIATLVGGLAATDSWRAGQIVVHLSPAFGLEVLAPAAERGALTLAIHPAMSFTGTSMDLARLSESFIAVTAITPLLPIGQALAVEMGGEPVVIADQQRPAYAEAISLATTFSTAVVSQAVGALRDADVDRPHELLAPLLRSTLDNVLRSGADNAIRDVPAWDEP